MAKASTADTKPAKTSKASKPASSDRPNVFARLMQYFRDVRGEMRRVVWPGRQEVLNSSVVVVVTLLFFVFFTLIFDSIAAQLLFLVTG